MDSETDYLQLLDLAYQVIESRAGQEEADARRYDCHKLAAKLCLHAATVHWLNQGTRAPVLLPGGVHYYDVGSVVVITRVALEAYLRMYEIFFEAISDDEREFRHAYWEIAGFVVREQLEPDDPEIAAKVAETRQYLSEQRARLERTVKFASLAPKQQKAAQEGHLHPESIATRAQRAGLGPKTIRMLYAYYSSYTHSDSLSIVQIMQAETREGQQRLIGGCLETVKAVLAKVILQYDATYDSAKAVCQARPQAMRLAKVYGGAASLLK